MDRSEAETRKVWIPGVEIFRGPFMHNAIAGSSANSPGATKGHWRRSAFGPVNGQRRECSPRRRKAFTFIRQRCRREFRLTTGSGACLSTRRRISRFDPTPKSNGRDVLCPGPGGNDLAGSAGRIAAAQRCGSFIDCGDDHRGPNNAAVVIPPGSRIMPFGSKVRIDLIMVYGTSTSFQAGVRRSDCERGGNTGASGFVAEISGLTICACH